VIRQTNWWQLGGKKPSLYRNSDGCLPRKLTDDYRFNRLERLAVAGSVSCGIGGGDGTPRGRPSFVRIALSCRRQSENKTARLIC
jgi:hypothetical protein